MEPREDILGAPFETFDLPLARDDEGEVVATLVRLRGPCDSSRAVLYLHGYMDYFYQAEMAERYVEQGLHFYALDLRKYGRSLRPHQTPNFCTDLEEYFEELDQAVEMIREVEGHDQLLLSGHSTGGLIGAIYAHRRRGQGLVDALFLNSPFFDFAVDPLSRVAVELLAPRGGTLLPMQVVPGGVTSWYTMSLHKDFQGSWDFNLQWVPVEGFPTRLGWLRAIQAGHRRVQAGLDIDCPVLVMHSDRSVRPTAWTEELRRADAVLDVAHMSQHCLGLGDRVARIVIPGGMHDLMVSEDAARERSYEELFTWLKGYF